MSSKKKKEVFNPFARRCVYTKCTPHTVEGVSQRTDSVSVQRLGEFQGTNLVISPALPKAEVTLTIQFSCTVSFTEGDVINIFLPGFRGVARPFALETVAHPDGLDIARCFLAYWSGDAKQKGAGKNGIPPKQVLQLLCTRELEENTLIVFTVPQSLGLVSPDKLANNSPKIKLEGKLVRCAEGRKIAKQSFLASTEIRKKVPIVEELEEYDRVINQLISTYQLTPEHRVLTESLTVEEVEQMWEAATLHRPYAVAMPWAMAPPTLFHSYEENGVFVKRVMESAVNVVKRRDPLAVHKEVAANWNIKLASVLMLEEVLAMQCAGLYPGLTRTTLLAVYLLTMLPSDVARVFATTAMPKNSIMQELDSAVRMRADMDESGVGKSASAVDAAGVPAPSAATASAITVGVASSASSSPSAGTAAAESADITYSERVLNKWSALTSHLLLARYAVSDEDLRTLSNAMTTVATEGGGGNRDRNTQNGAAARDKKTSGGVKGSRSKDSGDGDGWQARRPTAYLRPPPRLFLGLRDVSASELEYVQSLSEGSWFMLPSFAVAREEPPLSQMRVDFTGTLPSGVFSPQSTNGGTAAGAAASPTMHEQDEAHDDEEDEEEGEGGDASLVPDSAILFEIHDAVEGLELADLSLYPCERAWLLPFSSSYRILSVKTRSHLNGMVHVVLEMVGSLTGAITDELIPEGDQLIAAMVMRRLATESEKMTSTLPVLSQLVCLHVRRNERRRLHPPTLLRSEYLSRYQEVQWASEAKQTQEDGTVVWQVCSRPGEMLVEEVVKPSTWEPVPHKYATQVEMLFLGRTRTKKVIDEGNAADAGASGGAGGADRGGTAAPAKSGGKKTTQGSLVIDLNTFTIDYGGRGPRPLRRVVRGYVTHSAVPPDALAVTGGNNATTNSLTVTALEAKREASAAQLLSWNMKLGLVESPDKKATATMSGRKSAAATKPKKSAV